MIVLCTSQTSTRVRPRHGLGAEEQALIDVLESEGHALTHMGLATHGARGQDDDVAEDLCSVRSQCSAAVRPPT